MNDRQVNIEEEIVEDQMTSNDESVDLSEISRQIKEIPEDRYLEILASKH